MTDTADILTKVIAALEAQRGVLGDATVDAVQKPLRDRLAGLQPVTKQHLRQVSVLFVDIAGSTAMSRDLDPEDIHAIMDGALQRFTHEVQIHGGRVLKYAGDSVLAVFGAPTAHEDDAVRAVRAGLAALAAARAHAATLPTMRSANDFAVRAGIATGPVLLGGGIDGAASIRGAVVNLAARMEQTAPPGALRICTDTGRLVRGLFDLVAQPPLQVKGYDASIATWLVQGQKPGALPRATRGVGGVSTPLVGRSNELATLQTVFNARCAHVPDAPAVVVVVGDAGLGKSRLAAEFRAWTRTQAEGAYWLEAHADENSTGQPYGLLRQLFARHMGLLDSDSAIDTRAAWLRAMGALLHDAADAAVLGHLLGFDFTDHPEVHPLLAEGRQLRDRGFFHATQALQRIAEGVGRIALFLDDLQWADPGTLDFVEHVQREGFGPLLLLCTSRPALDEQRPGWATKAGRSRIDLAPLAAADACTLADALLTRLPQAPAALRQRLIDGADGNPFYMEELVNMLIDRGVIVEQGEFWRLGERPLDATAMPRTLAGVLQARLDELDSAAARALEMAAVVGHVFWADALRALGADEPATLTALLHRQFIVARPASTLAGQSEFAFRHHLLRQVCYERVLRGDRVPAHAKVAQWLAEQPGERPLDLIAEHHERGGQTVLALDAWEEAANAARARYANTQAMVHVQRALALVPADDYARQWSLRMLNAGVLLHLAQPELLRQELDALEALAALLDDDKCRAETAYRRAVYLLERGEAAESLRVAAQALAVAQAAGAAPRVAARAGLAMTFALIRQGRLAEARQRAESVLELASSGGFDRPDVSLLVEMGNMADMAGDFEQARLYYGQALEVNQRGGTRATEASILGNLGYVDLNLGDYDAARARFAQSRETFARVGQRRGTGIALINLALVSLHSGQPQTAIEQAGEALAVLGAGGLRWVEAVALRVLGQAALALGDTTRATAHLVAARDAFVEFECTNLALEADASLAQVALAAGDVARAYAIARDVLKALQDGESLDGTEEPMRVHLACWQALNAARDARADEVLAEAVRQLQARAASVRSESTRQSYLERVPHHRALMQAWTTRPGAAGDGDTSVRS